MSIKNIIAIVLIFLCTTAAWIILGSSLALRTAGSNAQLARTVEGVWGPSMAQAHPRIWFDSPGSASGRREIQPAESKVVVNLNYEPKRKGLLWYRTYGVNFTGDYVLQNPSPVTQTIFVRFTFPAESASYRNFVFRLNNSESTKDQRAKEGITESVNLEPGQTATLHVAYDTRGTDQWTYAFGETSRVRKFSLAMNTDFPEIDFPVGSSSPSNRNPTDKGWSLVWDYPDVIGAQPISMAMPNVLNPGPVAVRISFFAPVSLLFFFSILVIVAVVQRRNLHPMHFFFLAAGFFAFQLLFAYTVDLMPIGVAFFIAASVSLMLVSGYLWLGFGRKLAIQAGVAQFAYMVLFSYSFFFDGLTGITITIGSILTLALLMVITARVDWSEKFTPRPRGAVPPPIPQTL